MSQEGKSPMNVNTVPEPGVGLELEPQLRNSTATSVNIKTGPSKRLSINHSFSSADEATLSRRRSGLMFTNLREVRQNVDLEPSLEMAKRAVRVIRTATNKALREVYPDSGVSMIYSPACQKLPHTRPGRSAGLSSRPRIRMPP